MRHVPINTTGAVVYLLHFEKLKKEKIMASANLSKVRFISYLPPELYEEFKAFCYKQKRPMTMQLELLIERTLEEEAKGGAE